MKRWCIHYLLWLIGSLVLLLGGCSSEPVTGTETGNPEITACCNAIGDFFVKNDEWLPSTYLTEGEEQLNPEWASSRWNSSVAKRKHTTASAAENPDSTYLLVVKTDSIILVDTTVINDTLVTDTIIVDTVKKDYSMSEMADSLLIARYIRYDSVVVQRTVIKNDTVFVKYIDTVWASSKGNIAPSSQDNMKSTVPTTPDYRVVRDTLTGTLSIVPSRSVGSDAAWGNYPTLISPEIRSEVSYITIAERTSEDGKKISEAYHYSTGNVPVSGASGGSALLARGTVSYTTIESKISMQIDFDAGADCRFATTGDNRIHTLIRSSMVQSAVVDQVSYGAAAVQSDTVFLQRDLVSVNDSIEIQSTKYTCIRGSDQRNHRLNKLCSAHREMVLKNHPVKRMNVVIIPIVPVACGEQVATGTVFGIVDCGSNRIGNLHGVVDYAKGVIAGVFTIDSIDYEVEFYIAERDVKIYKVK